MSAKDEKTKKNTKRKRTKSSAPKVPTKRVEAILIDGKHHCPTCKKRNYKITNGDIGSQPGQFRFKAICQECGTKLVYETKL